MSKSGGTRIRRGIALGAGLLLLAGSTACATNGTPQDERPEEHTATNAGLGLASFAGTLVYAPLKLVYAAGGGLVGGLTWLFSGGNSEMAMKVVRPAVTGDYVLTPDHLRGLEQVHFAGGQAREASTLAQQQTLPHVSAGVPSRPPTCETLPDYTHIRFPVDQATLGSTDQQALRMIASALEDCPDRRFQLDGHADAMGEGPYNLQLSLRRATAVKDFLVREGVDPSRLETRGLGETQPLSTNDTPAGRASNRRVQFVSP